VRSGIVSAPVASRWVSVAIMALASLIGLGAFLYPFFLPSLSSSGMGAHANDAPLLTVMLLGLCLSAVFANLTGRQMTSKLVAVLGMLTAVNAVLRAVPGPAGFNAIFVLPILTGYAYGPTFGFLLGSLSLLVSAFIGGGIGPWLPYQMFATGWIGMLSAFLPQFPRSSAAGSDRGCLTRCSQPAGSACYRRSCRSFRTTGAGSRSCYPSGARCSA
jgi:energy-coupling factor transport system substrate-specific component